MRRTALPIVAMIATRSLLHPLLLLNSGGDSQHPATHQGDPPRRGRSQAGS